VCHHDPPPGSIPNLSCEPVEVPLNSGEALPGVLVSPPGEPVAPVLMMHDLYGASIFYEGLAKQLADEGFEVLLPDFFFRQGPLPERTIENARTRRAQLDEVAALDELAQSLAWLQARPSYHGAIGTVGFCMGGTFALDLASLRGDLVTSSFYGFPVVQPAVISPPPNPSDRVAQLQGPIQAHWGENDDICGTDHVAEFIRRCEEAGTQLDARIYPDVGHSFFNANTAEEAAVAQRAWAAVITHFRTHLLASGVTS
jgi:dienelactone hydrolase